MKNNHKRWLSDKTIAEILLVVGVLLGIGLVSYTIYQSLLTQVSPTMFAFGLINLLGYLFFIISPVEIFFVYMASLGHNLVTLTIVAMVTAMVSQLIDYLIGFYVSHKFLRKMITRKKYTKYNDKIKKYGNLTIFVFNLTPLSSPILLLVAGMIQYDLKDAMKYSFFGLLLKYIIISVFLV